MNSDIEYVKDLICYIDTGEYRLGAHPFSSYAAERNRLIYILRGMSHLHYFDRRTFDYDTLHRDWIIRKMMWHFGVKTESELMKFYQ